MATSLPPGVTGNTGGNILHQVLREIINTHAPFASGHYRWLDMGQIQGDYALVMDNFPTMPFPRGAYLIADLLALLDPIGRARLNTGPTQTDATGGTGLPSHTHTMPLHTHEVDRLPLADVPIGGATILQGLQPGDRVLVYRHDPGTPIVLFPVRFSS